MELQILLKKCWVTAQVVEAMGSIPQYHQKKRKKEKDLAETNELQGAGDVAW
jgi:hypothetical protein